MLKDLQFLLDCSSESWAVMRPWIFQADDVELQLLQLVLVLVPPLSLPTELPLHLVLMPPLSLPAGLHILELVQTGGRWTACPCPSPSGTGNLQTLPDMLRMV